MKKFNKSPLAAAMGTAVLSSLAVNVQADTNPFSLTELDGGYMQVAETHPSHSNGRISEGACGSNAMDSNGKKVVKGAKKAEFKKTEGSCGEGMCGAMMQGGKMKPGMEHACGAMMKGKDGACGMMMGGMNHDNDKDKKSSEGGCGAMMQGGKGGEGACGAMMKGGEGSCGGKVDADKAAGH